MYKNFRLTNLKNIIILAVYALFTLFLVFHHEIWADEAQVWLLAKNLSLGELFKHLVNEGHPSFFYLLVMPFAKLNFSVFSMQLICWASSCAAVYLLLRYSPFNDFLKTAIILSSGFLYFFPVIARSYSLLPFLVFASAVLYQKCKENQKVFAVPYAITLAMCANTHVMMFAFVFVLGVYFVYDNFVKSKNFTKQNIIASSIIFLSLLAVVVQLFGTFSSNGAIGFQTQNIFVETIRTFSYFFLNSVGLVFKSVFESMQLSVLAIIGAFLMFVLFVLLQIQLWLTNKKAALLMFLAVGFHFFIYIFSYKAMLYQTRIFSSYIILIFCFWIAFDTFKNDSSHEKAKFLSKNALNTTLGIFFLLTFFCGAHAAVLDVFYNYSSAEETAVFLEKNTLQNAVIIPNADAFSLAVYAFAPSKKFFSIYTDKEIKYMIWYKPGMYEDSDFSKLMETRMKENNFEKTYILVSSFLDYQHLEKTMPQKYKLIFKSHPSIATGEAFRVYEYKN